MNKFINEREDITTDITGIQRVIRDYYQKVCANQLENQEETDTILDNTDPQVRPRLNQEEVRKPEQTNSK